jgi:hypothetical protein
VRLSQPLHYAGIVALVLSLRYRLWMVKSAPLPLGLLRFLQLFLIVEQ